MEWIWLFVKLKNAQLSGRQLSLFMQKEVTTHAVVVHPIPKSSGKGIKRSGQNKKISNEVTAPCYPPGK